MGCAALIGLAPIATADTGLASKADSASAPCAAPEYRQFDFWIGEWEVRKPDGTIAGANRIEPIEGGCALRESWTGAKGGTGTSLNVYDGQRKVWHQTWVDSDGMLLLLEGGRQGESMVLEGTMSSRREPGVTVHHKTTWSPIDEGKVRQHWEASRDDGKTWSTLFEGIYARKKS